MPISAGQMRKVVRVEKQTQTKDAAGEPLTQWSLVFERRAQIIRTPGRELWMSQERSGRIPTTFIIRFPRDDNMTVLPQMRLTCDGRLYDIVSAIDPDGLKAELEITCVEYVNNPIEGSV